MKTLHGLRRHLLLFPILFLVGGLLYGKPAPPVKGPSRVALLQTVDHISQLAKEAEDNLAKEKADHVKATADNKDLQKKIDAQTLRLNKTIDEKNVIAKKLWWYRLHWFAMWAVAISGLLACGFVAFLKFTGRLTVLAANIAAKVP